MTPNFNITYHGDKTMAEINEVMMQTPSGRPSTSGILKELNSFTLNSQKMTLQGHAFLINDCHPPYLRCSIKSLMQIRIFDETSNEASGITLFDLTEEAGTNRASDHQWPLVTSTLMSMIFACLAPDDLSEYVFSRIYDVSLLQHETSIEIERESELDWTIDVSSSGSTKRREAVSK